MAKLKAFSAFDSKLKVWMAPMFVQHSGTAERTWADICNDPQSNACKHSDDFSLHQVGEFDDENGSFTPIPPVLLMTAKQAKKALNAVKR